LKGGGLMAERSKRLYFSDEDKKQKINPETIKLLKKYKMDMELRELSVNTIYQYETDLYQWLIYVYDNQGNQCVTDLDEDDLTEFFYYCKTEGNNSRRMKRRMASISAFYKYLRKKKYISENPMEIMDRPKKDTDIIVQTFLTKEQVDLMKHKLQEYVDNNGYRAKELQLYALFSLSTMARVNAVAHLRWDQIDFDERTCNDVLEKEGKLVTLYFNKDVKQLLLDLRKERIEKNIDDGGYVFNTDKEAIKTGTLNSWAKKIGEMIGVSTLHPHDFRHSGSQLLKLQGCSIEQISELLNHSGLDVTKRFYLRADKKKIQAEKDKYEI
jgi:site-specific recombinase XerD